MHYMTCTNINLSKTTTTSVSNLYTNNYTDFKRSCDTLIYNVFIFYLRLDSLTFHTIFAECGPGEKPCENGICISKDFFCDGNTDCLDNSDETNCSMIKFSKLCIVASVFPYILFINIFFFL